MLTIAQETGLGIAGLALLLGAMGAVILGIKDGVMKRRTGVKADAAARGLVPLAGATPGMHAPPRK